MRSRRAVLYVPSNEPEMIQKAIASKADAVCLDINTNRSTNHVSESRQNCVEMLKMLDFARCERLVRVNTVNTECCELDLAAVLPAHPDGIVVPQVDSASSLQWVNRKIAAIESENGWPEGEIAILAVIESARALVNLPQICAATPRLKALLFGGDNLLVELGAVHTRAGHEVLYARGAIVLHAAAFHLQSIDMAEADFSNAKALRYDARIAAEMGFDGKQVVHPDQVQPVQEVFTPDDESIAAAQALVDNYQSQMGNNGQTAVEIDGRVIDPPFIRTVERFLERARSAGKNI